MGHGLSLLCQTAEIALSRILAPKFLGWKCVILDQDRSRIFKNNMRPGISKDAESSSIPGHAHGFPGCYKCEHVRTQGITDAWWDASLEDPETETNSESEPSDNTVDGASQDSQDLPKTIEAMETTSEPESVPREEGPDVKAVDTVVSPEEGSEDEEATETTSEPESVPREEGPDVKAVDTVVSPKEGSEDEEATETTSEPESVSREEGPDVKAVDTAVSPEEGSEDEEATETIPPTEPLERGV